MHNKFSNIHVNNMKLLIVFVTAFAFVAFVKAQVKYYLNIINELHLSCQRD